MKQFFKFVLATIVGTFITGLLLIFVVAAIVGGIVASASSDSSEKVDANSILYINIKNPVVERSSHNPLDNIEWLNRTKSIGLDDILADIKKAKTDDNIKGIYIEESAIGGEATTEEVRNALIDFKKSKKFIIAYSEVYTQSAYYLASVADKVYLNPKGIFDFSGFNSQITFFKGALDKLGVDVQIIKVGTYKSAVEPFFLTKMSDANRQQVNAYLGSMYSHFLTGIGTERHLQKDALFSIANQLKIQSAEDALRYKLVDGLKYKDEVINELKQRTGTSAGNDLNSITLADYAKGDDNNVKVNGSSSGSNQIAVVYASGEISGGDGDDNSIGSETVSAALRKVRQDKDIKAVVLRVNSPGGSSLASNTIWREVMLTRQAKPVIVSMGDYAASGGYYISCAADSIFAEPNTITGSIGIFALLPNMQKFFNDKLGVTFDGVKTGQYADLGNISRPLTPQERAILQNQVNQGYDDFTKAVAQGRHKTQAYINTIGQGRVWTGEQALKIGLVDRLGNLKDAVASAAKKAGLKEYELTAYPEQKGLFGNINTDLSAHIKSGMVQSELGSNYRYYEQLKSIQKMVRIPQARLPYIIEIN